LKSDSWIVRSLPVWLTTAVLLLIATLTWFGYRAVVGWRSSAALVANRRAGEMADLLVASIRRDMRGVQTVVLPSLHAGEFMLDSPYDVSDVAASAFARYPYPESFFAWRGVPSPQSVVFLDRADRRPSWAETGGTTGRFPVAVRSYPAIARLLIDRIAVDAAQGHRFSTFELTLDGVPYQVVTRLLYRDQLQEQLEAAFGFTVNLSWVRARYFTDLTQQVARIGNASGLSLFILDDQNRRIAAVPPSQLAGIVVRRQFPVFFFDPVVVHHAANARLWAVEVGVAHDPTLAEAVRASDRTLLMLAAAAAALAIGLVLTLRATRTAAQLAEIRSDFVSTVTHELKTPIATIRAIGDTLARGRVSDPEARVEYAQLIVQESKRLSRLVDNLLAYSRITDVTEVYSLETVDVRTIIEEALRGFDTQFLERRFEVHVDITPRLPIRADRAAMTLMLDNIIDNAIRYSGAERVIDVIARRENGSAVIEVRDHGVGIPEIEIARVTRRFHRVPGTASSGSGLGLAIVKRIVSDHGGTVSIESRVGRGTTVRISLPVPDHD